MSERVCVILFGLGSPVGADRRGLGGRKKKDAKDDRPSFSFSPSLSFSSITTAPSTACTSLPQPQTINTRPSTHPLPLDGRLRTLCAARHTDTCPTDSSPSRSSLLQIFVTEAGRPGTHILLKSRTGYLSLCPPRSIHTQHSPSLPGCALTRSSDVLLLSSPFLAPSPPPSPRHHVCPGPRYSSAANSLPQAAWRYLPPRVRYSLSRDASVGQMGRGQDGTGWHRMARTWTSQSPDETVKD